MIRFLLLVFVFLVLLWKWRGYRAGALRDLQHRLRPRPPSADSAAAPVTMVSCAYCGIHLPAQEAVQGARGPYCSVQHQRNAE